MSNDNNTEMGYLRLNCCAGEQDEKHALWPKRETWRHDG